MANLSGIVNLTYLGLNKISDNIFSKVSNFIYFTLSISGIEIN